MVGSYHNVRRLVGSQSNIDAVKAILEEKVKGSFEVIPQEKVVVAGEPPGKR